MKSVGVTVSTQDNWLKSIPWEILKYLNECKNKPDQTLSQGNGFWMVIKYSTYSNWKYYSTASRSASYSAKLVIGFGGGAGYACDTSTEECSLTAGIKAGSAILSVGIDGEYNFADESFEMGATVDVGPCGAFLNYARISITCDLEFGGLGGNIEFGWKRNPYEAYWVLAHTSQITAAGGFDEFGKTVLLSRVYKDLDLNYQIMDSGNDRIALGMRYFKRGIHLIEQ